MLYNTGTGTCSSCRRAIPSKGRAHTQRELANVNVSDRCTQQKRQRDGMGRGGVSETSRCGLRGRMACVEHSQCWSSLRGSTDWPSRRTTRAQECGQPFSSQGYRCKQQWPSGVRMAGSSAVVALCRRTGKVFSCTCTPTRHPKNHSHL